MGKSRIRAADDLIAPAVAETLQDLDESVVDAGARRLAERYAAAIDEAHLIAADLESVLASDDADDDVRKRVAALSAKVEAQTVLDTLGPKLLAALDSLGATPKARARDGKGGAARGDSKLAALRNNRAG